MSVPAYKLLLSWYWDSLTYHGQDDAEHEIPWHMIPQETNTCIATIQNYIVYQMNYVGDEDDSFVFRSYRHFLQDDICKAYFLSDAEFLKEEENNNRIDCGDSLSSITTNAEVVVYNDDKLHGCLVPDTVQVASNEIDDCSTISACTTRHDMGNTDTIVEDEILKPFKFEDFGCLQSLEIIRHDLLVPWCAKQEQKLHGPFEGNYKLDVYKPLNIGPIWFYALSLYGIHLRKLGLFEDFLTPEHLEEKMKCFVMQAIDLWYTPLCTDFATLRGCIHQHKTRGMADIFFNLSRTPNTFRTHRYPTKASFYKFVPWLRQHCFTQDTVNEYPQGILSYICLQSEIGTIVHNRLGQPDEIFDRKYPYMMEFYRSSWTIVQNCLQSNLQAKLAKRDLYEATRLLLQHQPMIEYLEHQPIGFVLQVHKQVMERLFRKYFSSKREMTNILYRLEAHYRKRIAYHLAVFFRKGESYFYDGWPTNDKQHVMSIINFVIIRMKIESPLIQKWQAQEKFILYCSSPINQQILIRSGHAKYDEHGKFILLHNHA